MYRLKINWGKRTEYKTGEKIKRRRWRAKSTGVSFRTRMYAFDGSFADVSHADHPFHSVRLISLLHASTSVSLTPYLQISIHNQLHCVSYPFSPGESFMGNSSSAKRQNRDNLENNLIFKRLNVFIKARGVWVFFCNIINSRHARLGCRYHRTVQRTCTVYLRYIRYRCNAVAYGLKMAELHYLSITLFQFPPWTPLDTVIRRHQLAPVIISDKVANSRRICEFKLTKTLNPMDTHLESGLAQPDAIAFEVSTLA